MNTGKGPHNTRKKVGLLLAGWAGLSLLGGCQGSPMLSASANTLEPAAHNILQGAIAPFQVPIGAPSAQPTLSQPANTPASTPILATAIATPLGSDGGDTIDNTGTDHSWELTLYLPDERCDRLVPKTVAVQGDRPLDVAVGRVLIEVASDNLDLRGYQLTVNTQTRTAAIALRLRPGAARKFTALSSCEQLTLFGSIRATLTQNPQWPIDHVTFTDGRKTIRL